MLEKQRSPSFPRRASPASSRRDERRRRPEMNGSWQDLARKVAERESYARSKHKSSLRARIARRLFELAVAAEREETWRLVWERLEARGRL